MTALHEVRQRVLRERLEELRERAENHYADHDFIQLVTLILALLDRHHVDNHGRCHHCLPPKMATTIPHLHSPLPDHLVPPATHTLNIRSSNRVATP